MVKTSKFPVIAPDGTEYRVKIKECDELFIGKHVETTLYIPRKWIGYKKVYDRVYFGGIEVYDPSNLDLIHIATALVRDYYDHLSFKKKWKAKESEEEMKRKAAVIAFENWDGKIVE